MNPEISSLCSGIEQALSALPAEVPELAVSLRKAVGFRNILVHSYETINWEIVFALCTERLPDFERFAQSMAKQ